MFGSAEQVRRRTRIQTDIRALCMQRARQQPIFRKVSHRECIFRQPRHMISPGRLIEASYSMKGGMGSLRSEGEHCAIALAEITRPMNLRVFESSEELSRIAAAEAAAILRTAIDAQGRARFTAATGVSQIQFLANLVTMPDVQWPSVELFHLDEYVGLRPNHPASFHRYLKERLVAPTGIVNAHLMDGALDPRQTCEVFGREIASAPVDLTIVGIGENGHLAFNDPPADFETREPFITVELAETGRRQQVREGWFASLNEVPRRAVTMSIYQILQSRSILCIAPESRKADAIRRCFRGEIHPMSPASVLRLHSNTTLMLDRDSARFLD